MNKIIVVTGPSAVGKTYLADLLISEYAHKIAAAKVVTTRLPRPGETGTDRIFVSAEEYERMKNSGEFIVHGAFGGNNYGYTAPALDTSLAKKSIVVNTWPAMIPAFEKIEGVVIVGLSVDTAHLPLLEKRLSERSETVDVYEKRKVLIRQDIAIMAKYQTNIASNGKTFYISDDTSIQADVLPYILSNILVEK